MKKTFAILGSGMQGTAAAYDLARFADPRQIFLGDVSLPQAAHSARRVNELVGSAICEPVEVDALDPESLGEFLKGKDVLLSCVPYWMHSLIARAAIANGCNMVDLGGNTDVTLETLSYDEQAQEAGVTLIPDTGLAPGLVNSLALYLMEKLDQTSSIYLYCGVLPQHPQPPFNYKLTFNIEGLVTEYDYQAVTLKDGEIVLVDTLAGLETLHVEGLGKMEAFSTSGGTSTAPYSFQGKIKNYVYKTIRYPGHCTLMRIFKDFGFWGEDEINVKGCNVRPKDLFCSVFGKELAKIEDKDLCAIRAIGIGTIAGAETTLQIDIFDREDEVTGFTSMERLTGFSMSIHAIEVANGNVPKGAIRYEHALTGHKFLEELGRRGIRYTFNESA